MPKHIKRLIFIFVVFAILALAAKIYFVPASFWVYGHYRARSVTEIASDAPMYRGSHYCQSCHRQQFAEWSAGAHRIVTARGMRHGVICEDCHGPAGRHPLLGKPPPPRVLDTHKAIMYSRYNRVTGKMRVPKNTVALCTQCHEKMAGRPTVALPQIVVATHARSQQCAACHNPHTPAIVFPAVATEMLAGSAAAGKAQSAQCAACHGAGGMSLGPAFPDLAGQQPAYLVAALKAYKRGARKAPIMNGVAAALDNKEIANLAAYFSGLSRPASPAAHPLPAALARKARGEACGICHGEGGISRNPAVPSLAGQKEAYLASALEAYRSGTRKEPLMARVAGHLSPAEIKELAAFYSGLPWQAGNASSALFKVGAR